MWKKHRPPSHRSRTAIRGLLLVLALAALLAAPVPALARPLAAGQVETACELAARAAARRHGVPLDVLRAIALTETGRRLNGQMRAWPWTVNMEGLGKWFPDGDSALAYVERHLGRGARSFDVGCFQVNYRWHGRAFRSVAEMFDPEANADYAARFLRELFAEFGDWSRAAGAYHSRTPELARRYRARFDRFRRQVAATPPARDAVPVAAAAEPATGAARLNSYPLLRSGGSARRGIGSLVPLRADAGRGRFIAAIDTTGR